MKKLFLNILFLSISIHGTCQELDLSSYLSNVVSIGGGDFGIITGEVDSYTLSFITVGEVDSYFFNGISVKFHNTESESTAFLVKKFSIGKYIVALYECEKPDKLVWRADHYDFFSSNSSSYRTFLDNGKDDNQWSNYRDPISIINITKGIANLRMETQPIYSRGMPVLNDRGSIVGMISSKPSDEDHAVFEAIDFSIFETFLFDFGKCNYFNLIRYGQKTTICEEDSQTLIVENNDIKINRRKSFFAAAPAINPGVFFLPSKVEEYRYRGYGSTVGVNLHFMPDESTRFILKPRYGIAEVWTGSIGPHLVSDPNFYGLFLQYFEIPILLEFELDYQLKRNLVFSFGYVPAFQNYQDLVFYINTERRNFNVPSTARFLNKLIFELTYEKIKSRWSLVYWAQLNKWGDPNYTYSREYYDIQPFEGHRSISHFVGIEFSTRLWGTWLLKNDQQKPRF